VVLLLEPANWVQRMRTALIQLTEVLTDVMGVTDQAVLHG
jgi:hypothetical protein